MKKIKLLIPTIIAATSITPILTSCSYKATEVIPTKYLNITNNGKTLAGFKKGIDLTKHQVLQIPDGITTIANSAFKNLLTAQNTVRKIIFPQSLSLIQPSAFEGCDGVDKIDTSKWNLNTVTNLQDGLVPLFDTFAPYGNITYSENEEVKNKTKMWFYQNGLPISWIGKITSKDIFECGEYEEVPDSVELLGFLDSATKDGIAKYVKDGEFKLGDGLIFTGTNIYVREFRNFDKAEGTIKSITFMDNVKQIYSGAFNDPNNPNKFASVEKVKFTNGQVATKPFATIAAYDGAFNFPNCTILDISEIDDENVPNSAIAKYFLTGSLLFKGIGTKGTKITIIPKPGTTAGSTWRNNWEAYFKYLFGESAQGTDWDWQN